MLRLCAGDAGNNVVNNGGAMEEGGVNNAVNTMEDAG
ncbi:hypothetical protein TNCT_329731, partial [Trichonephila clavata]